MVAMQMRERDRPDLVGLDRRRLERGQRRGTAVDEHALASSLEPEARLKPPTISERVTRPNEVQADLAAHGLTLSSRSNGRPLLPVPIRDPVAVASSAPRWLFGSLEAVWRSATGGVLPGCSAARLGSVVVAESADAGGQQSGDLPDQPRREEPVALLVPDARTDEALVAEQPEA